MRAIILFTSLSWGSSSNTIVLSSSKLFISEDSNHQEVCINVKIVGEKVSHPCEPVGSREIIVSYYLLSFLLSIGESVRIFSLYLLYLDNCFFFFRSSGVFSLSSSEDSNSTLVSTSCTSSEVTGVPSSGSWFSNSLYINKLVTLL